MVAIFIVGCFVGAWYISATGDNLAGALIVLAAGFGPAIYDGRKK